MRDRREDERAVEDAETSRAAKAAAEAAEAAQAAEAAVQESDEHFRERFAQQWAEVRAGWHVNREIDIAAGKTNYTHAQVPYGVDLAAAWAWRMLVIAAASGLVLYLLRFFAVVVLPLIIALLLTALAAPLVTLLARVLPRKLAALVVELAGIAAISLLLTFVGQQVANGVDDLSTQVVSGLEEIRTWLQNGPLHASDSQINGYIGQAQDFVKSQGTHAASRLTEVGSAIGHIIAALFIILFGTYFFMADGTVIWAWVVRIFPRTARLRADSSGRVAWTSLTQFVRATVLVAGTDALGIMLWAAVLGLPLVSAIGVLVFLGAFVPLIGATLSGTVAVLVALVAKGPVVALIMLAGVVVVQQIEAHILQPFLMGRFVSVHPLGVIVAIACGVIVAGIAGALIAVPLAAAANAVVQHLATFTEDPDEATESDPAARPPADVEGEGVAAHRVP
jgi:predicted PurR-regulated permease PerM